MNRTINPEKKIHGFTVLCLDPSITAFGWAVIRDNLILEAGCIKTTPTDKKLRIRKGDDRCRRITEINSVLIDVIKRHSICFIVSEQPHGSQSAVAAIMIGITLGLIQTLADCLEIGLEWYSEGDSKSCVLGKHKAEKEEMVKAIDKLYKVAWTSIGYKDEAIADSVALYHTAKKLSPTIKMMLR
jgi:Holliday junction resolvasome RuvABC endonuclease subunit